MPKPTTRKPKPKVKPNAKPGGGGGGGGGGGRMQPPKEGVKLRMYRTGLGDCFLLAFPNPKSADGAFYMLIDCGVYFRTPTEDNAPRIRRIVKDIADATGGRLDRLVITHEHWDHVSAFHPTQAQSIFAERIKLDTLWMAWTEDLSLPLARDLHDGRRRARAALTHALKKMPPGLRGARGEAAGLVGDVLDFFGGPTPGPGFAAKKSVQTEEAMDWIRDKYPKKRTEFLHPGAGPVTFDGVPDVRVYVLGPPEDDVLIRRHEPRGDEVYPKAMAAAVEASFFAAFGVVPDRPGEVPGPADVEEACRRSMPFERGLGHPYRPPEAKAGPKAGRRGTKRARPQELSGPGGEFFQEKYVRGGAWRRIEGDWLEAAGEFALQLDNATNNTSLALAIEVGPPGRGKVLLFPGDAQTGNWLSWFGKVESGKRAFGKDMVWTAGGGHAVTAEDLLRRTVVYKVGHHGSHNATLRAKGLELMATAQGADRDFVAFLPVDEYVARDLAGYGEMPLLSLLKALAARTGGRIARSDEGTKTRATKAGKPTFDSKEIVPKPSSKFVHKVADLYFEYTVAPPPA